MVSQKSLRRIACAIAKDSGLRTVLGKLTTQEIIAAITAKDFRIITRTKGENDG